MDSLCFRLYHYIDYKRVLDASFPFRLPTGKSFIPLAQSTIKCTQMATITYCLNASMFIKGAFSFNITYAKTSTKVPSSGSDSCCWENNRRNSLKETLKFVLSTETELASS